MPVIPRFLTVEQRQSFLGPTIPAPERWVNEKGFVQFNVGDPVPLGIARALGWYDKDDPPLVEPEPVNASSRGRVIRAADRERRRVESSE